MNNLNATQLKNISSNNKTFEIFEKIIDPIAIINSQGIIYNINTATTEQFGYLPEDVIGTSVARFIPPKYHEQVFTEIQRAFAGVKYIVVEAPIVKKNGELIIASISGVFFNLEDGELVDAIFIRVGGNIKQTQNKQQQYLIINYFFIYCYKFYLIIQIIDFLTIIVLPYTLRHPNIS